MAPETRATCTECVTFKAISRFPGLLLFNGHYSPSHTHTHTHSGGRAGDRSGNGPIS